jgi:hypothetical protein
MVTFYIVLVALVVAVLGRDDPSYKPDPKLNWRPDNVTDLQYWLYAYTGS